MSTTSDAFLRKAQECLDGASSEFANGRYNNVANRAYYAAFQAAIAALDLASIRSAGSKDVWEHGVVQGQFTGLLINRRKRYPPSLRNTLSELLRVREQTDYRCNSVAAPQANRALRRAREFVAAVAQREQGDTA